MRKTQRRGFTLVELLVVIGIIALLISILLPSLAKARSAANTVACAANLRSIGQGLQLYMMQNQGYIPGPNTSGKFLLTGAGYSNTNCPGVICIFDWISPIASSMGISYNTGPAVADRFDRFTKLTGNGVFHCPVNNVPAVPFSAFDPALTVHIMNSYVAASGFMFTANGTTTGKDKSPSYYMVPASYGCKINQVGSTSEKIFVADGARYSNSTTSPDTDFSYNGGYGGIMADCGAYSSYSASWNRGKATGNGASGAIDARVFAYRHGAQATGPYRLNAVFFDGHVETLDDLATCNPSLWFPKGTSVIVDATEMYPDACNRWGTGAGQTSPMIVP